MRIPFTAARARNEGFARALKLAAELHYVQFVDGDCEVIESWLDSAVEFLDAHPDVAAVCGRRRERSPKSSIYNLLCDLEWDTPLGETKACGGDVMMRVEALAAVNGYRDGLIAGEEPELCVRLRASGWRIWRLDTEMTLHDAAMTRFSQWWRRSKRAGYAFAEGAALHGSPPERHWVRESRSAWFWGMAIPFGVVVSCVGLGPSALLLLLVYPIQVLRLYLRGDKSSRADLWRACFLVLGKFPEVSGQVAFMSHRLCGGNARLIEYK
jgi:GT2 family glycosyltransferase